MILVGLNYDIEERSKTIIGGEKQELLRERVRSQIVENQVTVDRGPDSWTRRRYLSWTSGVTRRVCPLLLTVPQRV